MQTYQAPDNSLHSIEPDFVHLLPAGSLPITEEEAQALRAIAAVPPTPLQEIASLEAAKPVTHRMLRELTLSVAEIASAITGKPTTENPAAREIQAMETQIAALRAQAKEQGLI